MRPACARNDPRGETAEVSGVVVSCLRQGARRPRDHRIRDRRGGRAGNSRRRSLRVEQRPRRAVAVARDPTRGSAVTSAGGYDAGVATLEATLMVVIIVPLLFAVIEFGWLFQRWLATESVAIHAARYAGELGGDDAALRQFIARELSGVNIAPPPARGGAPPPGVGGGEPIRVRVLTVERIALPFLFATDVPL